MIFLRARWCLPVTLIPQVFFIPPRTVPLTPSALGVALLGPHVFCWMQDGPCVPRVQCEWVGGGAHLSPPFQLPRRQNEENNDLSKQNTQEKTKQRLDYVPCPCLGCWTLPIPGREPDTSQLQMHCLIITVLAISDEQLLRDGIDILVQYVFFKKEYQPNFQCAAACCGMLQQSVLGHRPLLGQSTLFSSSALPRPSLFALYAHFVRLRHTDTKEITGKQANSRQNATEQLL